MARARQTLRCTVRRPDGVVEIVDNPGLVAAFSVGRATLARIRAATAAAGRGDVLSAELVDVVVLVDAETLAWDAVRDARGAVSLAERHLHEAEAQRDAAMAQYLAVYGQDGEHLAAERREHAALEAERAASYASSFVAQGLD